MHSNRNIVVMSYSVFNVNSVRQVWIIFAKLSVQITTVSMVLMGIYISPQKML